MGQFYVNDSIINRYHSGETCPHIYRFHTINLLLKLKYHVKQKLP